MNFQLKMNFQVEIKFQRNKVNILARTKFKPFTLLYIGYLDEDVDDAEDGGDNGDEDELDDSNINEDEDSWFGAVKALITLGEVAKPRCVVLFIRSLECGILLLLSLVDGMRPIDLGTGPGCG